MPLSASKVMLSSTSHSSICMYTYPSCLGVLISVCKSYSQFSMTNTQPYCCTYTIYVGSLILKHDRWRCGVLYDGKEQDAVSMDGMIDDWEMEQGYQGTRCIPFSTNLLNFIPPHLCVHDWDVSAFNYYFLYPLALQLLQEFVVVTHNAVDHHKTSVCTSLQYYNVAVDIYF